MPVFLVGLSLLILTTINAGAERESWQAAAWLLVFFLLLVLWGLALYLSRAKRVWLDQQVLHVSGFSSSLEVPLQSVKEISATRLFNPEHIRVHYRSSTGADESFFFYPSLRWFKLWSPHPLAAEMRQWVAEVSPGSLPR